MKSALPSKYTYACTSSTPGASTGHIPTRPMLIGWTTCPGLSSRSGRCEVPALISTMDPGLSAMRALDGTVLRSIVHRGRQVQSVLVHLLEATRHDSRRHELAQYFSFWTEPLVLPNEHVLREIRLGLLIEPEHLGDV